MGLAFWILCGVAVLLVLTIFELKEQHKRQHEELKVGLELQLESLKDKLLNALEDRLEEMSMSDQEKETQAFLSAPDLNLAFFEKLQKGEIVRLMSGEWHYPSDDCFIVAFDYKHDHIGDKDGFDYEVHGFERIDPSNDEWMPVKYLANEKECSTRSKAGTVKKAVPSIDSRRLKDKQKQ